jgi:hypothetical protein
MDANDYQEKYIDKKRGKLKFSRFLKKNRTQKMKALQRNIGEEKFVKGPEGLEFKVTRESGEVSVTVTDSAIKRRKATISIEEGQNGRRNPDAFGSFCTDVTKAMLGAAVPSAHMNRL